MSSLINRVLSKEDAALFKSAIKSDTKIVPLLEKILESKISELDKTVTEDDISSDNWNMVRTYRDGGRYYLNLFLQTIKEKD